MRAKKNLPPKTNRPGSTMRSKLHLIIYIALTAGALCACRPSVRHTYLPVDPRGWSCTDTLFYEIPADSVARLRTFSLGVRFKENYGYRGLWLVLEQRVVPSERIMQVPAPRRDTLYLSLAHENGRWDAQGNIYHVAEGVCTATYSTPGAPLQLLVYHIMPQQEIQGIMEVGVKVE